MIVYKFGGASVSNAGCIRNLTPIVDEVSDDIVIVVSALGKTTNALEEVVMLHLDGHDTSGPLSGIQKYHCGIADDLFPDSPDIRLSINESFSDLGSYLETTEDTGYDLIYDQVVSLGEIWATKIVAEWLNHSGLISTWVDMRRLLITDDRHRDANILWPETTAGFKEIFSFTDTDRYIVQGFIGGTVDGVSTTLGREGSDYTAAIIANILDAEKVVVWKDVDGIMNADPRWLPDSSSLRHVSYKEAVEMSFSGAKVIHPKTIKPLHNKNIPLYVRSFLNPGHPGTLISLLEDDGEHMPVYVRKDNQVLVSMTPHDLSFIMGDNLGRIFEVFNRLGIKVNLVQSSAVSLAVCVDNERDRLQALLTEFGSEFSVLYNDNAELLTIRQYSGESVNKVAAGRPILVEQKTRLTLRLVVGE